MKKILFGCMAFVAVVLMSSASFATQNATVMVKKATAKPDGVTQINLVKPAGNTCCPTANCWYIAPTGSDDQTLAVALTAMSLTSPVRIGISGAAAGSDSCVLEAIGLEAQ